MKKTSKTFTFLFALSLTFLFWSCNSESASNSSATEKEPSEESESHAPLLVLPSADSQPSSENNPTRLSNEGSSSAVSGEATNEKLPQPALSVPEVPLGRDFTLAEALQSYTQREKTAFQSFKINNRKARKVSLKQGSLIEVPANAFVTLDDKPAAYVELRIREFYSKADFLYAGLGTRSGDKILESGGMLYIEAKDRLGRELKLAPNKALTVRLKQLTYPKNDFKVFTSSNDAQTPPTDWVENDEDFQDAVRNQAYWRYFYAKPEAVIASGKTYLGEVEIEKPSVKIKDYYLSTMTEDNLLTKTKAHLEGNSKTYQTPAAKPEVYSNVKQLGDGKPVPAPPKDFVQDGINYIHRRGESTTNYLEYGEKIKTYLDTFTFYFHANEFLYARRDNWCISMLSHPKGFLDCIDRTSHYNLIHGFSDRKPFKKPTILEKGAFYDYEYYPKGREYVKLPTKLKLLMKDLVKNKEAVLKRQKKSARFFESIHAILQQRANSRFVNGAIRKDLISKDSATSFIQKMESPVIRLDVVAEVTLQKTKSKGVESWKHYKLREYTDLGELQQAMKGDKYFEYYQQIIASSGVYGTERLVKQEVAPSRDYVAKVTSLGWINCDRFWNTPQEELMTFRVKAKNDVIMVFKDANTILAGNYYKEQQESVQFEFKRIPKSAEVYLISIVQGEDKQWLAMQSAHTGADNNVELKYEEVSKEALLERLAILEAEEEVF